MAGETVLKVDIRDNDGPVCLTHSAPDEESRGPTDIYEDVPPSVVARSGVLTSIAEAGGDAKLPDFVTLSDFNDWRNTITADDPISLCTDFVLACTVLKTTDALDDEHFDDWLKVTADMLIERAIKHSFANNPSVLGPAQPQTFSPPQDLSEGLEKLPLHLVLRVVEALQDDNLQKHLGILLDVVPSQHHAPIVAIVIPSSKELRVPSSNETLPFFNALTALPASLLSLTVDGHSLHGDMAPLCQPLSSTPQEKSAAVAKVLLHHSSLTSLQLKSLSLHDQATMPALAPAIATLTALKDLHLGKACLIHADALQHLTLALHSLSRLERLVLEISPVPETPWHEQPAKRACKRKRAAKRTAPASKPKRCLATPLSALTALTSLTIHDFSSYLEGRFKATVTLTLPHLQHLKISGSLPNAAGSLLDVLWAPLRTLSEEHRQTPRNGDRRDAKFIWRSLPDFTTLESVAVSLFPCRHEFKPKLLKSAAEALASLPRLQELDVCGDAVELTQVMQELADHDVVLRRLNVRCGHECKPGAGPKVSAEEAAALLGHLNRLTQLQHINLHVFRMRPQAPGLAALSSLTQLTALHLTAWSTCLNTEADVKALAGMKELRSLCVDQFAVRRKRVSTWQLNADLVLGLGALPHLTQLAMAPDHDREDEGEGYEDAFAEFAPRAAWPALQWLACKSRDWASMEEIVRAVAAFPALREVLLSDDLLVSMLGDPMVEPCYAHSLRERLDQIAAQSASGFSLTHSKDWTRFHWKSECM